MAHSAHIPHALMRKSVGCVLAPPTVADAMRAYSPRLSQHELATDSTAKKVREDWT